MDSFTKQYIATALWSSLDDKDEPMDSNYCPEDIAPESLVKMKNDCSLFQEFNAEHITEENLLRTPDEDWLGSFGHDFWLTRNGHGTGFWDGDYTTEAGKVLTEASKKFGECNLYVGDDGKIYC